MRLGLTFAAGILVSFWVIAAVILVVQASAHNVSWGLLFQYPKFVVGMALVMFLFSLNLFGVFEVMLPGSATNTLAGAADREGLPGAFMKGVLATLLATPCTAPFLASAISFALSQTPAVLMGVFTAVGLGMAFPYLLLSARPGWMKLIPKPGTWMITFKQFTGFLLIGAVVWLLWILGKLRGESAIFGAICFMAFLSMAAWLYGRIEFSWPTGRKALTALACVAVLLGGGQFAMSMYDPPPQRELDNSAIADAEIEAAVQQARWQGDGIPWVPYKPGLAEALASKGYTVYVDYTAAWCLTCQVNKKGVLASAAVRKAMADARVIPIKADFTNQDPNISADLKRFESGGVPLNLVYPAGQNTRPIVLPSILTSAAVKEALGKAGPSQIASAAR
jgi:thiol:disulfide interchange protein DsbD